MLFCPKPRLIAALSFALAAAFAHAAEGPAKAPERLSTVSVALDKTMLLIGVEMPGEGVFGFDHPATNAQEKKVIADAVAVLTDKASDLFVLPADLGCKVGDVRIEASQAPSKDGDDAQPPKDKAKPEPANVDADYTLSCDKSPSGSTLKLGLLKAFPRLKKVKVQVLSEATESDRDVTSDQDQVKL